MKDDLRISICPPKSTAIRKQLFTHSYLLSCSSSLSLSLSLGSASSGRFRFPSNFSVHFGSYLPFGKLLDERVS